MDTKLKVHKFCSMFSCFSVVETLTLLSKHVGCYKTSLECLDHLINFYSQFGYVKEPKQNYLCKRFFS